MGWKLPDYSRYSLWLLACYQTEHETSVVPPKTATVARLGELIELVLAGKLPVSFDPGHELDPASWTVRAIARGLDVPHSHKTKGAQPPIDWGLFQHVYVGRSDLGWALQPDRRYVPLSSIARALAWKLWAHPDKQKIAYREAERRGWVEGTTSRTAMGFLLDWQEAQYSQAIDHLLDAGLLPLYDWPSQTRTLDRVLGYVKEMEVVELLMSGASVERLKAANHAPTANQTAPVVGGVDTPQGHSAEVTRSNSAKRQQVTERQANLEDPRMRIQAEAAEYWIQLLALNCQPTVNGISQRMAKWCIDNDIRSNGINPAAGTIRNSILNAKSWTPPQMTRAEAREHLEAKKQVAQPAQVSQQPVARPVQDAVKR